MTATNETVGDVAPPARAGARVLAVVGPTGVGKSDVADEVAVRLGAEIVSADSMQVYRGMDVGTAKAPPGARRVPQHCVDLVEPGAPFSAALYQAAARIAIDDILDRGRLPIVVGGTGLYVRAALDRMDFPLGDVDSPSRGRLEELADRIGAEALHARLADADPASAALIHPNNTRRVIRALEMLGEGTSYATQHAGFAARAGRYPTRFVGLTMDRAALYARIDERVAHMVEAGLLDEVRTLLDSGYGDALTAAQAIGYKQLVPVVRDGADLDDALEDVRRATRRYAKRQLSWFRADPRVTWLDVTGLSTARCADAVIALVESQA